MKDSLKTGFSFGLTSGIITTLGLIVGLQAGTQSKLAVVGGILTIAIADAFSDSLGIHISEEAENRHTTKEIWASTISTFVSKFVFALTFLVPISVFNNILTAIIVSIVWGITMLSIFSFYIARKQNASPFPVITEHILIAIIVILASHYAGKLIHGYFNT